MCGFFAILDFDNELDLERAKRSLKSMAHRGPDASNFISDGSGYFIGHNRLSVIDLSENANQPIYSNDGKYFIVFNGEIYNYKELKKNLPGFFKTNSDTEILLNGYLNEGVDFFNKLRGMYAFMIGNLDEGKYMIGRDPIGIKPLYVFRNGKKLIASSELKGIVTYLAKGDLTINEMAVKVYIHNGYISEPDTVYKEVTALNPGSVLEYNNGNYLEKTFFAYDFDSRDKKIDLKELEKSIKTAVNRNLIADIDISVALSGELILH